MTHARTLAELAESGKQTCTRCQTTTAADYCAECKEMRCPWCMEEGCCGHTPAISGIDYDDVDSKE